MTTTTQATTTLTVEIVGPNLHDQSTGSFHVHTANCRDLSKREYNLAERRSGKWIIDATSIADIVSEVYSDFLPTNDDNEPTIWTEYEGDIHVFPCVTKHLPREAAGDAADLARQEFAAMVVITGTSVDGCTNTMHVQVPADQKAEVMANLDEAVAARSERDGMRRQLDAADQEVVLREQLAMAVHAEEMALEKLLAASTARRVTVEAELAASLERRDGLVVQLGTAFANRI